MKGLVMNRHKGRGGLVFYQVDINEALKIPLFASRISAGFPSPADDHIDKRLDLNELIIRHPSATFFLRVKGDSMEDANIFEDDILVVDRARTARSGDIIVCVLNGEFCVRRFIKEGKQIQLVSDNPAYESIPVGREMDFEVWGVVTYTIHKN